MHTAYPSLDAAMVLFQSIVEIRVGSVRDRLAEFSEDRPRVSIVPIAGDPIRDSAGHRPRRPEEPPGRGQVTALTQHHLNQRTITIDGAVQIAPSSSDLDVGFIDVPTRRQPATAAPLAEFVRQNGRELRLPLADRLVTEHDTADEEHLGQIAKAQPIAQTPEDHERDDIARVLGPVQDSAVRSLNCRLHSRHRNRR